MNLFFYAPLMDKQGKELYQKIGGLCFNTGLELHCSLGSLSKRLCQPIKDFSIAILYLAKKENLLEILSIRDLLFGIRIILVLPNRETDTISKAHILGPTLLDYSDSDFTEVGAVLNKMLSHEFYPYQQLGEGRG